MFNKEQYWARRNNTFHVTNDKGEVVRSIKKPMRGQFGDIVEPVHVKNSDVKIIEIAGTKVALTRAVRRKKVKSRLYTKKGYRNGIKVKK